MNVCEVFCACKRWRGCKLFVFPSPFNRAGLGLNVGGPEVRRRFSIAFYIPNFDGQMTARDARRSMFVAYFGLMAFCYLRVICTLHGCIYYVVNTLTVLPKCWYHAAHALLSVFSNVLQVVAVHSIQADLAHTFDMKCYRHSLLI